MPLYEELIQTLRSLAGVSRYEILFVDDGSTDKSFSILQCIRENDPHVKIIQFRRNFGQTAAFAAGFEYANGDLIATLDADGQNNPADIPRLIEVIRRGDYDFAVGWRIDRKEPYIRRIVSGIANRLISISTHVNIHDRGCSLKLYKRDLVKSIRLYGQLHRFVPELVSSIGARVVEVPVEDRSRRSGKSKYGALTRTPRVLLDLFTVFYFLSFFNSPMRFFGSLGLVSLAMGFVIGIFLAATKIYYGIIEGWPGFHAYEIGDRPLLLLAVLLILIGVQFFMMGLLGEMIMRVYYESGRRPVYYIRQILR